LHCRKRLITPVLTRLSPTVAGIVEGLCTAGFADAAGQWAAFVHRTTAPLRMQLLNERGSGLGPQTGALAPVNRDIQPRQIMEQAHSVCRNRTC
jgi:hypothetical protein